MSQQQDFTRPPGVCIPWEEKRKDKDKGQLPELPAAMRRRDLKGAAPPGAQQCELVFMNPWTGEVIPRAGATVSGTDPGDRREWLGSVDIWSGRMEAVVPTGFDERAKEDVLVIIRKQ